MAFPSYGRVAGRKGGKATRHGAVSYGVLCGSECYMTFTFPIASFSQKRLEFKTRIMLKPSSSVELLRRSSGIIKLKTD